MKKIIVTDECAACGMCALESNIFLEKADGKAEVNKNIELSEENIKKAESIAKECMSGAIKIVEDKIVNSEGKQGLEELYTYLETELNNLAVMPEESEYRFNKSEYSVPAFYGSGEYRYDYRNDDKAMAAGLKEFDRVMYSQRKALIQQVLVSYRHNKLMKYAIYENKEGNFYYDIKKRAEEVLTKVKNEAITLSNNKNILDKNFNKFEVKPDFGEDDLYVYQLKHLEEMYFVNDVMNELESLYWYETFIDTDDMEDSRGRYMYCYKNIYEVCKMFGGHILDEINFVLSGSEGIKKIVEDSLSRYVSIVKNEFNKKLELFYNCQNNIVVMSKRK